MWLRVSDKLQCFGRGLCHKECCRIYGMSQTVPTYLLLEDLRTQQSGTRCENAAPDTLERRYHGPVFLASFVRLNLWLCISTCEMRSLLSCSGRAWFARGSFCTKRVAMVPLESSIQPWRVRGLEESRLLSAFHTRVPEKLTVALVMTSSQDSREPGQSPTSLLSSRALENLRLERFIRPGCTDAASEQYLVVWLHGPLQHEVVQVEVSTVNAVLTSRKSQPQHPQI